jgi:hypothetical protein
MRSQLSAPRLGSALTIHGPDERACSAGAMSCASRHSPPSASMHGLDLQCSIGDCPELQPAVPLQRRPQSHHKKTSDQACRFRKCIAGPTQQTQTVQTQTVMSLPTSATSAGATMGARQPSLALPQVISPVAARRSCGRKRLAMPRPRAIARRHKSDRPLPPADSESA